MVLAGAVVLTGVLDNVLTGTLFCVLTGVLVGVFAGGLGGLGALGSFNPPILYPVARIPYMTVSNRSLNSLKGFTSIKKLEIPLIVSICTFR